MFMYEIPEDISPEYCAFGGASNLTDIDVL